MWSVRVAVSILVVAASAGCGPGSAYSSPVSVSFGFDDGDVRGGGYSETKNIGAESGDPYELFLTEAQTSMGGRDPSSIEVTRIRLLLDPKSIGVASFADVFESIEVRVRDDSGRSYALGRLEHVGSRLPLEIPVTVSRSDLAVIQPLLEAGRFEIGLRATTLTTRPETFAVSEELEVTFRASRH